MYRFALLRMLLLAQFGRMQVTIDILQILQNALHILGYPAVLLFVMIESSGIPFPGETMLLLASFYCAIDHQLQLPIIIGCAALGAILGDNIGYYIGKTGGKAIVDRYGRYVFLKPEHLARAEQFFARHGDKTIFLGRFVAVLRAWAAFLAGVNRMHWETFFLYNASGGIVWATIYGLLGYFAGRYFQDNFSRVEHLAGTLTWITTGVIIAAVIIIVITMYIRRRKRMSTK
ncbi:MAG TPA: DedA family protein [Ktedonobacteraceae bacterium]|nr:DedA family protein [Ktedonobacteraceae bacterium]